MIGKQISFFDAHPWASAGEISSSGQRRHPAAACATCEVIAKSRRRIGTRVDTEQRSAHLTWLGADLVSSQKE